MNNLIKAYNAYGESRKYDKIKNVKSLILRMPCLVVNVLESTNGKFADYDTGHLVIMEYDQYLLLLSDYLPMPLSLNGNFTDFLRNEKLVNLQSYADHVVMALPSPRYEWYLSDNFDVIQKRITDYTNTFVDKVGFYPVAT